MYNPIEQEIWKLRVLAAERKAMSDFRTKDA